MHIRLQIRFQECIESSITAGMFSHISMNDQDTLHMERPKSYSVLQSSSAAKRTQCSRSKSVTVPPNHKLDPQLSMGDGNQDVRVCVEQT